MKNENGKRKVGAMNVFSFLVVVLVSLAMVPGASAQGVVQVHGVRAPTVVVPQEVCGPIDELDDEVTLLATMYEAFCSGFSVGVEGIGWWGDGSQASPEGGSSEPPEAEAESEGNDAPTLCTAQAGSSCQVACTAGSNSRGSIIVYATKTSDGSGYVKTEAIGDCVEGGSVATESHVKDKTESNSAGTKKSGTMTCKVTAVGGAEGHGKCHEPDPIVADANDAAFCMLDVVYSIDLQEPDADLSCATQS